MARPDDITEAAWAEAVRCAETVCRNLDYDDCTVEITAIARALMAAEARGRAEEREACASYHDNLVAEHEAFAETAAGTPMKHHRSMAHRHANYARALRKRSEA